MYNIFNGSAPSYLDSFHRVHHSYKTRNSANSLKVPHCKSHSKVGFEYNGIVLWNGLPTALKHTDDKNVFKIKCKRYLLQKMFCQENCDFV